MESVDAIICSAHPQWTAGMQSIGETDTELQLWQNEVTWNAYCNIG